jgi:pantoate--beta-alanine ligase
MQVYREIRSLRGGLREARGRSAASLGFVPTMGALHAGHISLVERARRENELVAASIFVNPMQFGPGEDFDAYPRTEESDLAQLEAAGCDHVLIGETRDLYPSGFASAVQIRAPWTAELEGAKRPGHFDGVATVVSKLFHIFDPERAYFGLKDLQQVALIQQLVRDLDFDLEIVPCEVVREADGLAMSSRNRYLGPELREKAPRLHQSLVAAKRLVAEAPRPIAELESRVREQLEPDFEVDYVDVRILPSFERPLGAVTHGRIVCTARLGPVRLLDNLELGAAEGPTGS